MRHLACTLVVLLANGIWGVAFSQDIADRPEMKRQEWTTSRIVGTPDPPLPFIAERIFPDVQLKHPTEMIPVPGTDRWIVTQLNGDVISFSSVGDPDQQMAIDLRKLSPTTFRVLGIEFHPEYPQRPWCYVAYADEMKSPTGAKLSRFKVTDTSRPVLDPSTETVLLKWNSTDHNGGNIRFGPDGYLYLSIGDGQYPSPPDPMGTGQSIDDIQASILRIDVDRPSGSLPYTIPTDNPFVGVQSARAEVWALGLRNPWKMCFHPNTGELWTGDVGWEMREMIYRIDRGANYGWSVMEGTQVVKPTADRSHVPITPPIWEHDHVDARSITGGFFWLSDKFPELNDAYIYGDWMTGKIWGLRYDGKQVSWHQELADTNLQIISFAYDPSGEVLIVGYDGSIHRLAANPDLKSKPADHSGFPQRLSETGLFESVTKETPAPGVIPYQINAHHWADDTYSKQWLAVPQGAKLGFHQRSDWTTGTTQGDIKFPHNTVLAKTIYYTTRSENADSERRLETQILHRHRDDWNAYNYVWNKDQTDAVLQANKAVEVEIEVQPPGTNGKTRKQTWLHASRDQCMLCHIWSAGTVHGFKLKQLNRAVLGGSENQLDRFDRWALFESPISKPDPVASPYASTANLESRAREYLQLNCAHCHRPGGGGTAAFVLSADVKSSEMGIIDSPAVQGDFGIHQPNVVASGAPDQSVLLYRMLKSGRGHMPQFGTNVVDRRGVKLIHDWIASLSSETRTSTDQEPVKQLIRLSQENQDISALLEDQFSSTTSAMNLAMAMVQDAFPEPLAERIAAQSAEHPKMEIRDLFESFLPSEQRKKRLGSAIDLRQLLDTPGDPIRGQQLYFESDLNCKQCHQIHVRGTHVGPALTGIGSKRSAAEILNSILFPSLTIEEGFRGIIVVTVDGEILSGLKVEGDPESVQLIDADGTQHTFPLDDIEEQRDMTKSLMPDQLLSELTLQEAADLLSFLVRQKSGSIDN